MFDTLYSQIGFAVVVAVAAFAFLKGDEPERVGAGAYLVAMLASLLVQNDSRLYGPQWGMMAVDVVMLAIYAGLAWKSRRAWPIWGVALQSLTVMIHLMTAIDPRPPIAAFYAVMNLAGYGILAAIAAGTFAAWQDRRAAGTE